MIRVLIADSHRILRRGIREILEEAGDMFVAGEVGDHQQLPTAVREYQFDVLVLIISTPKESDLKTLKAIYRKKPDTKVLILTMGSERRAAGRALQARAYGYLTRESTPQNLIAAIRMAARGEKYSTQASALELGQDKEAAHEVLSEREFQILRMLAAGKSPTEIGRDLGISIKTVSTYRSRIIAKLKLKNTAEIIRYALKHGLTD